MNLCFANSGDSFYLIDLMLDKERPEANIKEALVNELKGNLFEYVLALEVSQKLGIKHSFLKNIPQDYLQKLNDYDNVLRSLDSSLYVKLPQLAKTAAEFVLLNLSKDKIEKVELIGKSSSTGHEGDLRLTNDQHEVKYISLKFCKKGSYVNTKSAGLKTFIAKYFSSFSSAPSVQLTLNNHFEICHERMLQELNRETGLGLTSKGLHSDWEKLGYSLLPGKLPPHLSLIIHRSYYQIAELLYFELLKFDQEDSAKFNLSLRPLLGFSSESICQLFCFYDNTKEKNYDNIEMKWLTTSYYEGLKRQFISPKEQKSSLTLSLASDLFQIRVKPMSSFLAPSYKINCSLKFH